MDIHPYCCYYIWIKRFQHWNTNHLAKQASDLKPTKSNNCLLPRTTQK